ncbi:phosphatidylinositol 4-phosphate 5-kinase type-1 beta-like [Macrosteles quadrilineatus]|uniref:phosphatidylinositol 4-phosphate 5-kinase type-1 beta-like n=1 Tax=Macrosteles quadrilineatus TaxID=74068 RepID=UPI0023E25488|nr:phosphatidylinositol 4-phosphate 5-kinase type-1 beta-like [Macrosteles quadrilineatus]
MRKMHDINTNCIVNAIMKLMIWLSVVSVLSVNITSGKSHDYVNGDPEDISQTTDGVNEDEYSDGKMSEAVFIKNSFKSITSLIPESVQISRFQENVGRKGFLCTSETTLSLQVLDITSDFSYQPSPVHGYREVSFQASVIFKKPLIFETFMDEFSGNDGKFCDAGSKTGFVHCTFPKESYVNVLLAVPEFSKYQTKLQMSQCTVYINRISVESVSYPVVQEIDNKVRGIGERLWNSIKEEGIKTMMNNGIVKALLSKLQSVGNRMQDEDWVCLSDGLLEFGKHIQNQGGSKGKLTYVKHNPLEFINSFQLGIEKSVSAFRSMETVKSDEPIIVQMSDSLAGKYEDFYVLMHAPLTFQKLRNFFGIEEDYYFTFFCQDSVKQIPNPANSGAKLYMSPNGKFIAKTLRQSEVETFQLILKSYFEYVSKTPDTLLTKMFGLYTYEKRSTLFHPYGAEKDIVVMNNIMPANEEEISQRYDLKGAEFRRKASEKEKKKTIATFKDKDFLLHHSHGIYLKANDYERLRKVVTSDSKFLLDFNISDYSLLLGIIYEGRILNKVERERPTGTVTGIPCESKEETSDFKHVENNLLKGLSGFTVHGERVMLYLGIIDWLQNFNIKRRMQDRVFSLYVWDHSFSITDPKTYASRFIDFMGSKVFRKMQPCLAENK